MMETMPENRVNAQAFCATYILGKRYGVDVSGFDLEKVAGIQEHGQKDPQELRLFLMMSGQQLMESVVISNEICGSRNSNL